MNARQKAKMYKGSYRYSLTVNKCLKKNNEGLERRLNVLGNMAKQLNNDSGYWQGLFKGLASEKVYTLAVEKMVMSRRGVLHREAGQVLLDNTKKWKDEK